MAIAPPTSGLAAYTRSAAIRALVEGNTVMRYKDALNELQRAAPGTKAHFLFGFLDRVRDQHFAGADSQGGELVSCDRCGLPTTAHLPGQTPVCAFCRTRGRLLTLIDREDAPVLQPPTDRQAEDAPACPATLDTPTP